MATKAYSVWIYDRHCTLIYHHDWSLTPPTFLQAGPDLLPGVSRCIIRQPSSSSNTLPASNLTSTSLTRPAALALTDQAKLIYGLVFSLRNMLHKLSVSEASSSNQIVTKTSRFNTYSTPTYTLAHFQSPSMYTFVLLTDPVSPPVRAGAGVTRGTTSAPSDSYTPLAGAGGGIPGTGGMSLPGVLKQIVSGPWMEWVIKNPALDFLAGGVETEEMVDVELDEEREEMRNGGLDSLGSGDIKAAPVMKTDGQNADDNSDDDDEGLDIKGRIQRTMRRRGIDSDGFRGAIEAVLAQNKLSTSHSSA